METEKNVITGKLFVFNGEYPFTFENNVLHISVDVSNKEVVPLSSGNFKESILAGVFENDSKFISFYLEKATSGLSPFFKKSVNLPSERY